MDYMISVVTDKDMLRDTYGPWDGLIGGIGECTGIVVKDWHMIVLLHLMRIES